MGRFLVSLALLFVSLLPAPLLGPGAAHAQATELDLLIRGGRIVDGTGNPSYLGDVGIKDGRVVAVGRFAVRGRVGRTIDAKGLVVAPGFVDIHNHSDHSLLVDGGGHSMVH